MPLPIPDIMQKVCEVLNAAKKFSSDQTSANIQALKDAAAKVHPDDVNAVMNEIGTVYRGLHNQQILSFGSRPNLETGMLEMAIVIEFGLGPRTLITGIPVAGAEEIIKNMSNDIATLAVKNLKSPRIISNASEI